MASNAKIRDIGRAPNLNGGFHRWRRFRCTAWAGRHSLLEKRQPLIARVGNGRGLARDLHQISDRTQQPKSLVKLDVDAGVNSGTLSLTCEAAARIAKHLRHLLVALSAGFW